MYFHSMGSAVSATSTAEGQGINDRVQLALVERHLQRREAERLMASGVTIADPSRVDLRGTLTAGHDCFIDINVVIEGAVTIGDNVTIVNKDNVEEADRADQGFYIRNSIVVIVKNATIPDGTII